MSDQFSEWDRFYAIYKRSLTAGDAFRKYRRGRKKKGKLPKTISPQQRLQMEYEKRIEQRRVETLKRRAEEHSQDSVARVSKTTT